MKGCKRGTGGLGFDGQDWVKWVERELSGLREKAEKDLTVRTRASGEMVLTG